MAWHGMALYDMLGPSTQYPQAGAFLPHRWGRGAPHLQPHPFASLPWGFGPRWALASSPPRMCLGRKVAELEMLTLLAAIVTRFQVRCRERLGHHITPGGLAGRGDEGALQHPALPRGDPALHLPEAIEQLHSTHQIDISKNVKSVQIFNKIWRNIIFKMHISKLVKTG